MRSIRFILVDFLDLYQKICTKVIVLVRGFFTSKVAISESEVVKEARSLEYEKKTRIVVVLTAITMVAEIGFGYYTKSMALLADGWHMASHTLALGLTWIAYYLCRKFSHSKKIIFSGDKLLSLSGLISALLLQVIAVMMAIEAVKRMISPVTIMFGEAIVVVIIGLAVNVASAFILFHDPEKSDNNIKAAYFHVMADALTSITAIIALLAGMLFQIYALDAISGILSSLIITKWSVGLIRDSGKMLIDFRNI